MEVSNVAPDLAPARTGTAPAAEPGPAPNQAAGNQAAGNQAASGQPAATVAPLADRADIRPLDIPAALQILLAEVRAQLESSLVAALIHSGASPGPALQRTAPQSPAAQTPVQTARELAESFLQALPEDAGDVPAWTAALVLADAAVLSGMESALGIVTQWRDVPAAAIDAVKDTRALFVSAMDDDPPNPLWLQPEWMGLSPLFRRFVRRRRNARRRLSDPDYSPQSLDDVEEL